MFSDSLSNMRISHRASCAENHSQLKIFILKVSTFPKKLNYTNIAKYKQVFSKEISETSYFYCPFYETLIWRMYPIKRKYSRESRSSIHIDITFS